MISIQFLPAITLPDKTYGWWEWMKWSPKMKWFNVWTNSLKQCQEKFIGTLWRKWILVLGPCLVPVRRFPSPSPHQLTFSHGPRDPKRFGREEKWGLGTRQPRAKDCTKKGNPARRHWQDFSVVESCMQIFYWILKNNNNNNNNNNNKNNNTNKW